MTNDIRAIAMRARFDHECSAYGSRRLAVHVVAAGRSAGVSGLPATDEWREWQGHELRTAVEYLEHKRGRR